MSAASSSASMRCHSARSTFWNIDGCGSRLSVNEASRMVDQIEVPGLIDQHVALVPIAVADQAVEHLHPDELQRPGRRLRERQDLLPAAHAVEPQDRRTGETVDLPFDHDRDHVQLERLVELIRGNLRFVTLPEAAVIRGLQRLPGERASASTGLEHRASRLRHANGYIFEASDLGFGEALLDFSVAPLPDVYVVRWRCLQHQDGE